MSMRAIYDVTPELLEWLNHTLVPMEEPVFRHFKGIQRLTSIVDRAEAGKCSTYAAHELIDEHNKRNGTAFGYAEIRDRVDTYVFYDFGKWVAYMDNATAQRKVLDSPLTDPEDAFLHADPDINWIVLLLPSDHVVVVYRSPHIGLREVYDVDTLTAWGTKPGNAQAYTLPPEIEASLGQLDPEEIFHQYPHRSRTDARRS